jgi:3-dehydroquinate synthase
MQEIFMETQQRKYNICISNSEIDRIPNEIMTNYSIKKWLIITDDNVANLYLNKFKDSFVSDEIEIYNYIIPHGESSKSLGEAERIFDFLSEHSFNRNDGIIALGGGVVGDLSGFVASTYLRGIPWIQVPTTLLAQVDSSVGGKVAINSKHGKNLIGSFYQPNAVYVDISFLNTLDISEVKSGLGEVIKYACIYDQELFEFLEQSTLETMDWHHIVNVCINIKKYFVENDEREENLRKHLNFGHTLGHGLERYEQYQGMSHGEGVVKGIMFSSWLSHDLGFLSVESYMRILAIVRYFNYGFLEKNYNLEKLFPMILKDKKSKGDHMEMILLKEIGESTIYKISNDQLKNKLEEGLL